MKRTFSDIFEMDEVYTVSFFAAYILALIISSQTLKLFGGSAASQLLTRQLCSCHVPVPGMRWMGLEMELTDIFNIGISVAFGILYLLWSSNLSSGTGWLATFAMTLALLPATQHSLLTFLLRSPFQRTVKLHRWAGYGFLVLLALHIGIVMDRWGVELLNYEVRHHAQYHS